MGNEVCIVIQGRSSLRWEKRQAELEQEPSTLLTASVCHLPNRLGPFVRQTEMVPSHFCCFLAVDLGQVSLLLELCLLVYKVRILTS